MGHQYTVNNRRVEEAVTYTKITCCKVIRRHKIGNISVPSDKILLNIIAFHWQSVIFNSVVKVYIRNAKRNFIVLYPCGSGSCITCLCG